MAARAVTYAWNVTISTVPPLVKYFASHSGLFAMLVRFVVVFHQSHGEAKNTRCVTLVGTPLNVDG